MAEPRAESGDPVIEVELERERIADSLHGGLMQSLVVARHSLERDRDRAERADPASGLPSVDDALSWCLAETRRLVWHLRPRTLEVDLRIALDQPAHRLDSDGGARLDSDVDGAPALAAAQAALVYRAVQAVAVAADPGTALAVTVTGSPDGVLVRVSGVARGLESEADVSDRIRRAAARGVLVELVSP